jgi:signal transduction histidine kinase
VLANAINNIGEGLHSAVDASVKNERLKTDLITNVSHDIKTPLTSIINYVDLLKRENIEDEKIKGYIDILDNKSQRLKNLTEDLVEASKISSGNIKLEMSKINFVELINQTEGEFSEKLEVKGLQIIKTLPIDSVFIQADGRRMWRVIENLYNNVAKYAMPNTRVYVDVKAEANKVMCSIKNISENPLNINADELTERFIRGDVSRSTEGSGLGLSIAKNLTSLQKGTFDIYLDGDLFKVTITFPKVE